MYVWNNNKLTLGDSKTGAKSKHYHVCLKTICPNWTVDMAFVPSNVLRGREKILVL